MTVKYKLGLLTISVLCGMASGNALAYDANNYYDDPNQVSFVDRDIDSAQELLDFQTSFTKYDRKEAEIMLSKTLELKAMADYAKSIAIRSAIKSRMKEINRVIARNERNFDAIYDFNQLMIEQRVVPPVISEATRLYNQSNATQINIADRIYNIEKQAKFSSTAPNWRGYLQFPIEANAFEKYAYAAGAMQPEDDIERKVWRDATIEGWNLGIQQADIILRQALDRLNRDFIGMIRFHQFVMQGKISMPAISRYNLHNTNTGTTMVLNENLLRITVLPTFHNQAAIKSMSQHRLKPNEDIVINEDALIRTPEDIGLSDAKIPNSSNELKKVEIPHEGSNDHSLKNDLPITENMQGLLNGNQKQLPPSILDKAAYGKSLNIREKKYVTQRGVGIYGGSVNTDSKPLIQIKDK